MTFSEVKKLPTRNFKGYEDLSDRFFRTEK